MKHGPDEDRARKPDHDRARRQPKRKFRAPKPDPTAEGLTTKDEARKRAFDEAT